MVQKGTFEVTPNCNPKKVIITGITGSGGSYLAEYIANEHPEVEIHGIARWHSTSGNSNLAAIASKVKLHECDLNDLSAVYLTLKEVKPDAIFHIASHANVRASFNNPLAVMNNNINGTANLFEAVRLLEQDPVIQLCSTSEVYGQVDPKFVPINEDCAMKPASPYAVSKVTQDLLGFMYYTSYKMRIIRTRMFAYLNPRRRDLFATAFAMQAARIEQGLQSELLHGNLDSVRTIVDVRDAMRAYWLATLYCQPGEAYNIGGQTVIKVGEFLDLLKKQSKVPIKSRVDPALLRPADVTLQIPNVDRFVAATRWKPEYSFEQSVEFLLDYCRREAQKEAAKR